MYFKAQVLDPLRCSLNGTHCKGDMVLSRKQVSHKLPGTKGSLLGPKRVPRIAKLKSAYNSLIIDPRGLGW